MADDNIVTDTTAAEATAAVADASVDTPPASEKPSWDLFKRIQGLVEKVKFPLGIENKTVMGLLNLLTIGLAIRGGTDIATGDAPGEFRLLFDRIEELFAHGVIMGKDAYSEAKRVAKELAEKGSGMVVDYTNTAFQLDAEHRVKNVAEVSGFLAHKGWELYDTARQWEIPHNEEFQAWLQETSHNAKAKGLFWDRVKIVSLFTGLGVFLGVGLSYQHSPWIGVPIGIALIAVGIVLAARKRLPVRRQRTTPANPAAVPTDTPPRSTGLLGALILAAVIIIVFLATAFTVGSLLTVEYGAWVGIPSGLVVAVAGVAIAVYLYNRFIEASKPVVEQVLSVTAVIEGGAHHA
ncbi:MAG: hypothetical protein PHY34_04465 [Patescibacteria group bacterium]|nr:hypothetical protein [Patescibacteria group bacterium]MDD5715690.1 hypothetical protein [Patescibacteria group bacterium]